VLAFAPAIGPTVAGVIIDSANWHIMFCGIAVLAFIVVIFGAFALEKTPSSHESELVLDKVSVVLSSLGFGAVLYGFSTVGSVGINVFDVAITLVGIVSLVFFFRRQLRMEHPMLRVQVLKNRRFLIGTVIGMIIQSALLVVGIMTPIYVQSILGLSATTSGLILLPGAIIMGIMGPIAGRLFDRFGPRVLSIVGTGVLTATSIALSLLTTETPIAYLFVVFTVRLFSLSLVNMPITTWAMNALDDSVLNHGTSVNNTLRQVAGSLGTAIVISVYTSVAASGESSLGWLQANMLGVDIAFGVSATLCLIAFIMVVLLVKPRPSDGSEADPHDVRKTLLETIMKNNVYSVPETATVSEVVQLFVDKGISAAPIVTGAGKAIGFISDGDIMRALSKRERTYMDPIIMIMRTHADEHGFDEKLETLMSMNVKSIGSMGIVGVDVHADLAEVCRVLGENRLKKVPVTHEGRLVGVVNRSDITQYAMRSYLESHSAR
jgi:MFS transporter, DHA2 family, multidrug resistance protein